MNEEPYTGGPYLQIDHIKNESKLKNVGTALHELAFRESVKLGGYGKIHKISSKMTHP